MTEETESQGQPDADEQPEGGEQQKEGVAVLAERAGMLPQYTTVGGMPRLNPKYTSFKAALDVKGWKDTDLVTQQEFDEALQQVDQQVYR